MIKLGIIGDIGSGKSYVAKQFGYPVFDADREVSEIYRKDKKCYNKLKKKLPKYINCFPVKKKELKNAVLKNKRNIVIIEKIIHPIVKNKIKKFIKKNKRKKLLIFDIPLLLEKKSLNSKYILLFVDAKQKDIRKRIIKRKGFNNKILNTLKKSQLPLEIKKKKSDYVIKNDFNKFNLKKSVNILKNKILS
tara:strand:- start:271 stop:843 length:573 start_codon:yes stop_codon:yes gene_type:complete